MLRINNIKMPINHNDDDLKKAVENMLDINKKEFKRKRNTIVFLFCKIKNSTHFIYYLYFKK